MTDTTASSDTQRLATLDQQYVWHPFTPMQQWREQPPMVIERGEGPYLFDTEGARYIDGVSSLWCNVHGHRHPAIDAAVRDQLDKIAHTTLLGLASPPSIELARQLAERTPGDLCRTFYSDAGATAVELAFKMAVGYWHHKGQPERNRFIGLAGCYHGDTTGAMSVGYSDLFHRPFASMVFPTHFAPSPDPVRLPDEVRHWMREKGFNLCAECQGRGYCGLEVWPSECTTVAEALKEHCLTGMRKMLEAHRDEVAAIVVEPMMQGAAGMVCQPHGYLRGVEELAREFGVLLIADEVATGFGRTGKLFACEHENVTPDIMCLAKGISAGYLPLAATICTEEVESAFCGPLEAKRTLYHGHTYTGNPLACAAAVASLQQFDATDLLSHIRKSGQIITDKLQDLRDSPHVLDIRQRGLMTGIEICKDRDKLEPFDFSKRTAFELCLKMRPKGLIIRPLGDVMILMPIPAMDHATLEEMLDIVVETTLDWPLDD